MKQNTTFKGLFIYTDNPPRKIPNIVLMMFALLAVMAVSGVIYVWI